MVPRYNVAKLSFTVGVLALLAAAVGVGWLVKFETEHPCIRYGAKEECTAYHQVDVAGVMMLIPYQYDCTPCLERLP